MGSGSKFSFDDLIDFPCCIAARYAAIWLTSKCRAPRHLRGKATNGVSLKSEARVGVTFVIYFVFLPIRSRMIMRPSRIFAHPRALQPTTVVGLEHVDRSSGASRMGATWRINKKLRGRWGLDQIATYSIAFSDLFNEGTQSWLYRTARV